MALKTPAAKAERNGQVRHNYFWYPARCEHPGCTCDASTQALKRCGACKMVQYCGPEHQTADWAAHKEECKVFQRLGLHATFYRDEEMLARCPLRPGGDPAQPGPPPPRGARCDLCGKGGGREALMRSGCCSQAVCGETDHMSYSESKAVCFMGHDRYTLCGYHMVEAGCDEDTDWRECPRCLGPLRRGGGPDEVAGMLWRGLNNYNVAPMLSKDVPRHARCETCIMCHKKFMSGVEGCVKGREGLSCQTCRPML